MLAFAPGLADLGQEAHIQQAIGFIQHEVAHAAQALTPTLEKNTCVKRRLAISMVFGDYKS